MHGHMREQRPAHTKNSSAVSNICKHTHTHTLTTQHVFQSTGAKRRPLQRTHYLAISSSWALTFWTILSQNYDVSVGLYCFPLGKKRIIYEKGIWKKDVEPETDQDSWVTITDAISWALMERNRLHQCSPRGPLLKWGINPSASLKCMLQDSGKLLSAGLFACLLPSRPPHLPCGKALIEKVWCLLSSDCWHNYVLQRAKQCLERGLRAAIKWYETISIWGHECQEQSLKIPLEDAIIPVKQQTTIMKTFHINNTFTLNF